MNFKSGEVICLKENQSEKWIMLQKKNESYFYIYLGKDPIEKRHILKSNENAVENLEGLIKL